MCGIAGIVARERVDEALLRLMADRIAHRGPDDQGIWADQEARVGFGHRRLAIVDLSAAGHQPMVSGDGRWVLTYNGEIYNHAALRAELEDTRPPESGWRGHSDTETLLECISAWGLERTLAKCVGMFAIALWDRRERRLHLIRDRFGEKPLHYGWVGGDFVFASELKAIRALPGFDNAISRRAAALFTRLGYIPAPHSIFEQIYKLEPGCMLSVTPDELPTPLDVALPARRYWSYRDVVLAGAADPIQDEREALERLDQALDEAVRGQAVADVPVGAFLSGGIDSSTVVAFYRRHFPVKSFTIGFEEEAFDEAPYAREVARHLGTDHHEHRVTVAEAQAVIPLLPAIYDEPFADSSQIPTYLVSRHARGSVKVALSGDGGDELFGGYNRYLAAPRLWTKLRGLPKPLRAAAGQLPSGGWNALADLTGRRSRQPEFGARVQKALRTMAQADGIDDVHLSLIDEWHGEPSPVLLDGAEWPLSEEKIDPALPDAERMMLRDALAYLPGDILCKVDRAAMAVNLETRVPFLDHRVAELAAHIPAAMKIQGGVGKQPLRKLLYRDVPAQLFERPKTGFAIPVGEWLKGPLRPWAEELLDPARLRGQGFFDAARISRRWQEHLSGRRDSTPALWFILMFQSWLDEQRAAQANRAVAAAAL
jgi:asparagine synthase (glutamine-hydrolysing)